MALDIYVVPELVKRKPRERSSYRDQKSAVHVTRKGKGAVARALAPKRRRP